MLVWSAVDYANPMMLIRFFSFYNVVIDLNVIYVGIIVIGPQNIRLLRDFYFVECDTHE